MDTHWFFDLYHLPELRAARLHSTVAPDDVLVQTSLIACALIAGIFLGRLLGRRVRERFPVLNSPQSVSLRFCAAGVAQVPPLCALVIIWLGSIALHKEYDR